MTLEIQVLAWDRHKTVAELKWLMRSQSYVHSMFIAHQQLQIFLLRQFNIRMKCSVVRGIAIICALYLIHKIL
jgi:hypothetical protein